MNTFKSWINESSVSDLYQSTIIAFPNTVKRQYATDPVKIVEMRWTPFVGLKTLFIKGLAQNEEREYNPIMIFKDVNYNSGDINLIASDGMLYRLEKISKENNDVMVRCNCPDHYWRFRHFNYLDHSLYGKNRKKYKAKTNRGPVNPLELPGLCKHLIKLSDAIKESGIFG